MQQADIFIYHHIQNQLWVDGQLRSRLHQAEFSLYPTVMQPDELATAVDQSHHVLLILSPHFVAQAGKQYQQNPRLTAYLNELHQQLTERFTNEDLRELSYSLGLDYDDLAGETKTLRFRSLLEALQQNNRLDDLLSEAKRQRPSIPWPAIPEDAQQTDSAAPAVLNFDLFQPAIQQQRITLLLREPCTIPEPLAHLPLLDVTEETLWDKQLARLIRQLHTTIPYPLWPLRPQAIRWRNHYRRQLQTAVTLLIFLWVILSTLFGLPPFQDRLVWVAQPLNADDPIKEAHFLINSGQTLLIAARQTDPGCNQANKGIWYQNNTGRWISSDIASEDVCLPDWQGPGEDFLSDIIAIAPDPTDSSKLYALTSHSALLLSQDGGRSFHAHPANQSLSKLVVEPRIVAPLIVSNFQDQLTIWVVSANQGIQFYRDGQWQRLDGSTGTCANLPELSFLSLLVTDSVLLIGTRREGLWLSEDNGRTCRLIFDTGGDPRYEFHGLWAVGQERPRYLAAVADRRTEPRGEPQSGFGIWQLIDLCPLAASCTADGWTADTQPIWYNDTSIFQASTLDAIFVQPAADGKGFNWYLITESGQSWQGDTIGSPPVDLPDIRRCYSPISLCRASFATTAGQFPLLLAKDRLYRFEQGKWWHILWP